MTEPITATVSIEKAYPFKEKDRVWIVRDEHNYEPGTIAVIKEVKEHNGSLVIQRK